MSVSLQTKNKSAGTDRHWQNLQTLLLRSPLNSNFLMKRPPPAALPSDSAITQLLLSCSSNKLRLLLTRHLLSALALFNTPPKESQTFHRIKAVQGFFPEIDHDTFTSASWIAAPVPVIQGCSAAVLTLMLGLTAGKGRVFFQSTPCIDQSSRKTLETVFQSPFLNGAGKEKDLLVWTLQNEDDQPLKGMSLGLPAAIGLHLLNTQKQWPHGLFASGEITAEGNIRAVKNIREKARVISRESQLFVVPAHSSYSVTDSRMVSVQTIKEAVFAVNCFQNEIHDGNSIALFQLAVKDPKILLANFKRLPAEFFRLSDLAAVFNTIKQAPVKYFSQLASCLRENSYKIEQTESLASLFTCDDILQLAISEEFTAVKYCLGLLAFHNHSGNITQSTEWSKCAEKITTSLNSRKELSQLVNNDFVSERFNRYDFRTEIPAIYLQCLAYEEKLHEVQEDDSLRLGAMYGTLAQNYGFCGSEYLGNLREMVQKALAAFGRKYRSEHSQVRSYLIYGLLDSRQFAEAKSVLQQYLGLAPLSTANDWLSDLNESKGDNSRDNTFKTCLVCRFLAEQQLLSEDEIVDNADLQRLFYETLQQSRHPWQLTSVNLARLYLQTQNRKQAVQLLNHAVSICLNNGETMQAMALLPLSLLQEYNLAGAQHYQQAEYILAMISSSSTLNRAHFTDILSCRTGQSILEQTVKGKSVLFPFSYR